MHSPSRQQLYPNHFCLPSKKGSTFKEKKFPRGIKFFPFRVGTFSEGMACRETNKKQKVVSLVKMAENHPSVSRLLSEGPTASTGQRKGPSKSACKQRLMLFVQPK